MAKKKKVIDIRRDYKSMQPIRVDSAQLSLNQICYGTIDSSEIIGAITPEGYIHISKSWLEIIMIMIDTVVENSKNISDCKKTFMKYGVTSQTFNIDTKYGIISLDPNRQFKVYQVYNRKLYLETLFQVSDIFQALIGLSKACGYALDEFTLDIRSKECYEKMNDFYIIDDSQIISDISGWALLKNEVVHIDEFLIFSERLKSPSLQLAAWQFMNYLLNENADNIDAIVIKLPSYDNVAVEKNTGNEYSNEWTPLYEGKYMMKFSLDGDNTIRYIMDVMRTFDIPFENFQIKFRRD